MIERSQWEYLRDAVATTGDTALAAGTKNWASKPTTAIEITGAPDEIEIAIFAFHDDGADGKDAGALALFFYDNLGPAIPVCTLAGATCGTQQVINVPVADGTDLGNATAGDTTWVDSGTFGSTYSPAALISDGAAGNGILKIRVAMNGHQHAFAQIDSIAAGVTTTILYRKLTYQG